MTSYGLTEAAPGTHSNPVYDRRLIKVETIGLPIHDTKQKIGSWTHSVCLLAVSKPQGFFPLHHYRWQMLKTLRQMRYTIHEGKVSPQGGQHFSLIKRAWCEEAI